MYGLKNHWNVNENIVSFTLKTYSGRVNTSEIAYLFVIYDRVNFTTEVSQTIFFFTNYNNKRVTDDESCESIHWYNFQIIHYHIC